MPHFLPDPDKLEALAAVWEQKAADLDRLSDTALHGFSAMDWHGAAQSAAFDATHGVVASVRKTADLCRRWAEDLREQASKVRQMQAELAKQDLKTILMGILGLFLGVAVGFLLAPLISSLAAWLAGALTFASQVARSVAALVFEFAIGAFAYSVFTFGVEAIFEGIGSAVTGTEFTVNDQTWQAVLIGGLVGGLFSLNPLKIGQLAKDLRGPSAPEAPPRPEGAPRAADTVQPGAGVPDPVERPGSNAVAMSGDRIDVHGPGAGVPRAGADAPQAVDGDPVAHAASSQPTPAPVPPVSRSSVERPGAAGGSAGSPGVPNDLRRGGGAGVRPTEVVDESAGGPGTRVRRPAAGSGGAPAGPPPLNLERGGPIRGVDGPPPTRSDSVSSAGTQETTRTVSSLDGFDSIRSDPPGGTPPVASRPPIGEGGPSPVTSRPQAGREAVPDGAVRETPGGTPSSPWRRQPGDSPLGVSTPPPGPSNRLDADVPAGSPGAAGRGLAAEAGSGPQVPAGRGIPAGSTVPDVPVERRLPGGPARAGGADVPAGPMAPPGRGGVGEGPGHTPAPRAAEPGGPAPASRAVEPAGPAPVARAVESGAPAAAPRAVEAGGSVPRAAEPGGTAGLPAGRAGEPAGSASPPARTGPGETVSGSRRTDGATPEVTRQPVARPGGAGETGGRTEPPVTRSVDEPRAERPGPQRATPAESPETAVSSRPSVRAESGSTGRHGEVMGAEAEVAGRVPVRGDGLPGAERVPAGPDDAVRTGRTTTADDGVSRTGAGREGDASTQVAVPLRGDEGTAAVRRWESRHAPELQASLGKGMGSARMVDEAHPDVNRDFAQVLEEDGIAGLIGREQAGKLLGEFRGAVSHRFATSMQDAFTQGRPPTPAEKAGWGRIYDGLLERMRADVQAEAGAARIQAAAGRLREQAGAEHPDPVTGRPHAVSRAADEWAKDATSLLKRAAGKDKWAFIADLRALEGRFDRYVHVQGAADQAAVRAGVKFDELLAGRKLPLLADAGRVTALRTELTEAARDAYVTSASSRPAREAWDDQAGRWLGERESLISSRLTYLERTQHGTLGRDGQQKQYGLTETEALLRARGPATAQRTAAADEAMARAHKAVDSRSGNFADKRRPEQPVYARDDLRRLLAQAPQESRFEAAAAQIVHDARSRIRSEAVAGERVAVDRSLNVAGSVDRTTSAAERLLDRAVGKARKDLDDFGFVPGHVTRTLDDLRLRVDALTSRARGAALEDAALVTAERRADDMLARAEGGRKLSPGARDMLRDRFHPQVLTRFRQAWETGAETDAAAWLRRRPNPAADGDRAALDTLFPSAATGPSREVFVAHARFDTPSFDPGAIGGLSGGGKQNGPPHFGGDQASAAPGGFPRGGKADGPDSVAGGDALPAPGSGEKMPRLGLRVAGDAVPGMTPESPAIVRPTAGPDEPPTYRQAADGDDLPAYETARRDPPPAPGRDDIMRWMAENDAAARPLTMPTAEPGTRMSGLNRMIDQIRAEQHTGAARAADGTGHAEPTKPVPPRDGDGIPGRRDPAAELRDFAWNAMNKNEAMIRQSLGDGVRSDIEPAGTTPSRRPAGDQSRPGDAGAPRPPDLAALRSEQESHQQRARQAHEALDQVRNQRTAVHDALTRHHRGDLGPARAPDAPRLQEFESVPERVTRLREVGVDITRQQLETDPEVAKAHAKVTRIVTERFDIGNERLRLSREIAAAEQQPVQARIRDDLQALRNAREQLGARDATLAHRALTAELQREKALLDSVEAAVRGAVDRAENAARRVGAQINRTLREQSAPERVPGPVSQPTPPVATRDVVEPVVVRDAAPSVVEPVVVRDGSPPAVERGGAEPAAGQNRETSMRELENLSPPEARTDPATTQREFVDTLPEAERPGWRERLDDPDPAVRVAAGNDLLARKIDVLTVRLANDAAFATLFAAAERAWASHHRMSTAEFDGLVGRFLTDARDPVLRPGEAEDALSEVPSAPVHEPVAPLANTGKTMPQLLSELEELTVPAPQNGGLLDARLQHRLSDLGKPFPQRDTDRPAPTAEPEPDAFDLEYADVPRTDRDWLRRQIALARTPERLEEMYAKLDALRAAAQPEPPVTFERRIEELSRSLPRHGYQAVGLDPQPITPARAAAFDAEAARISSLDELAAFDARLAKAGYQRAPEGTSEELVEARLAGIPAVRLALDDLYGMYRDWARALGKQAGLRIPEIRSHLKAARQAVTDRDGTALREALDAYRVLIQETRLNKLRQFEPRPAPPVAGPAVRLSTTDVDVDAELAILRAQTRDPEADRLRDLLDDVPAVPAHAPVVPRSLNELRDRMPAAPGGTPVEPGRWTADTGNTHASDSHLDEFAAEIRAMAAAEGRRGTHAGIDADAALTRRLARLEHLGEEPKAKPKPKTEPKPGILPPPGAAPAPKPAPAEIVVLQPDGTVLLQPGPVTDQAAEDFARLRERLAEEADADRIQAQAGYQEYAALDADLRLRGEDVASRFRLAHHEWRGQNRHLADTISAPVLRNLEQEIAAKVLDAFLIVRHTLADGDVRHGVTRDPGEVQRDMMAGLIAEQTAQLSPRLDVAAAKVREIGEVDEGPDMRIADRAATERFGQLVDEFRRRDLFGGRWLTGADHDRMRTEFVEATRAGEPDAGKRLGDQLAVRAAGNRWFERIAGAVHHDRGGDPGQPLPQGDWYREKFQQRLLEEYTRLAGTRPAGGLSVTALYHGVTGQDDNDYRLRPLQPSHPFRAHLDWLRDQLTYASELYDVLADAARHFDRIALPAQHGQREAATVSALADRFRRDAVHRYLTARGLPPRVMDAWLRREKEDTDVFGAMVANRAPAGPDLSARAGQATGDLLVEYAPRVRAAAEVQGRRPDFATAFDQRVRDAASWGQDLASAAGQPPSRFRTLDGLPPAELTDWRHRTVADLTALHQQVWHSAIRAGATAGSLPWQLTEERWAQKYEEFWTGLRDRAMRYTITQRLAETGERLRALAVGSGLSSAAIDAVAAAFDHEVSAGVNRLLTDRPYDPARLHRWSELELALRERMPELLDAALARAAETSAAVRQLRDRLTAQGLPEAVRQERLTEVADAVGTAFDDAYRRFRSSSEDESDRVAKARHVAARAGDRLVPEVAQRPVAMPDAVGNSGQADRAELAELAWETAQLTAALFRDAAPSQRAAVRRMADTIQREFDRADRAVELGEFAAGAAHRATAAARGRIAEITGTLPDRLAREHELADALSAAADRFDRLPGARDLDPAGLLHREFLGEVAVRAAEGTPDLAGEVQAALVHDVLRRHPRPAADTTRSTDSAVDVVPATRTAPVDVAQPQEPVRLTPLSVPPPTTATAPETPAVPPAPVDPEAAFRADLRARLGDVAAPTPVERFPVGAEGETAEVRWALQTLAHHGGQWLERGIRFLEEPNPGARSRLLLDALGQAPAGTLLAFSRLVRGVAADSLHDVPVAKTLHALDLTLRGQDAAAAKEVSGVWRTFPRKQDLVTALAARAGTEDERAGAERLGHALVTC